MQRKRWIYLVKFIVKYGISDIIRINYLRILIERITYKCI